MVSAIASANAGYGPSPVDQFFKKVDSDGNEKITKSELTQALEADSVDLGSSTETAVDAVFSLFDAGNKGYITEQNMEDGLKKLESASTDETSATGESEGASRPAGGGGGGGGGGAAAATSYDPADTNQDGVVSMQERLAYMVKQYSKSDTEDQSQSTTYAYA
jgi:Ca2+-binding EF-hand superfamily protein